MFYKLTHIDEKELPDLLKKQLYKKSNLHNRNTLPMDMVPLTEEEFSKSGFFTYGFQYKEFRQAAIEKDGPHENLMLFWNDDGTGYCLVHDYWAGKVKYFRVGHVHEWVSATSHSKVMFEKKFKRKYTFTYGRCCHNEICSKCGLYKFTDSSD